MELHALPSDVQLVLPLSGIKAQWLLTTKERFFQKPEHFRFGIDGQERPWYGHAREVLYNPTHVILLKVAVPYVDFAWLENGELVVCTDAALGYLRRMEKAESSLTVMGFKSVLPVPHKDMRIFSGADNTLYLAGKNPKTGNYEVYLLRFPQKRSGMRGLRVSKILESPQKVQAVAGDGLTTYIATGMLIAKLIQSEHEAQRVFLHPSETIMGLAYSKKAGLFYATGSGVGFVHPKRKVEFLKASDPEVRLRNNALYIYLATTQEVLKIEGLQGFADVSAGAHD